MKTIYFKNKAESTTETDANGQAWQITTYKRSNGFISCIAIQVQDGGNGCYTWDVFGAKRIELAKEKTIGTEKAIRRVHDAGLLEFDKTQTETKAPYVVGIGQIIFNHDQERNRVVYEVIRPGKFKTVTLDGKYFLHDDYVKPYSEKFGIGSYYNEGDILPAEQVKELVLQATAATAERERAANEAKEKEQVERANKIAEGSKIIAEIPDYVKAVIVAELRENTSDPQSDYWSYNTIDKVYLSWSAHTRDIFPELRKAAGKFEPTKKHEAERQDQRDEHREKGEGFYLGDSKYCGWIVRKYEVSENNRKELTDKIKIAAAEGKFFCEAEPEPAQTNFEKVETEPGTVQLIDYSEKAFAVVGDTKPVASLLGELGGKFNKFLKCGPGWIFSKKRIDQVTKALKNHKLKDEVQKTVQLLAEIDVKNTGEVSASVIECAQVQGVKLLTA